MPPFGDRRILDNFQKHSYPIGIVVNMRGERFVDEGANYRTHTMPSTAARIVMAGELMSGKLYGNYLGGAGPMSGAVFGRLAGEECRVKCDA